MNQRASVRIIGGTWRGRKLKVLDRPGLRPTTDRVRETLFNWLRPTISGARCLDCFAGTGILGFEALSQGAHSVCFVEKDRVLSQQLHDIAKQLDSVSRSRIILAEACRWLSSQQFAEPFDIIFVDPPYALNLMGKVFDCLHKSGAIGKNTLIYFEDDQPLSPCPDGMRVVKQATYGMVSFHLIEQEA